MASNPDPKLDDTPTNDNELHQVIFNTFKIDYFQEMDTIKLFVTISKLIIFEKWMSLLS